MSVISSKTLSIASILKAPGARAQLVGVQKKITFRLPSNIKEILTKLETLNNTAQFEELKNIIKHSQIKSDDFIKLLNDVRECIPILKPIHKSFIEVLLDIEWRTQSPEAISLYKKFVDDLMDVHTHYYKFVLDKLLVKLKSSVNPWEGLEIPSDELEKQNHIHDIFRAFLKNRPLSSDILMSSLISAYPHYLLSTQVNKAYLLALLQITEYAPALRRDILFLIIKKLTILDVNNPPSELEKIYGNDDMDDGMDVDDELSFEERKKKVDAATQLANTLDICLKAMYEYIRKTCYVDDKLDMDSLKSLLHDLIYCFDNIILPTHASRHIQFIMFYICSFKSSVLDAFVRFLWLKFSDHNTPCVLRQYAIFYIASLLSRSKHTPLSLIHEVISEMANWIHSYIQQDNLQGVNTDLRAHVVFYFICQAMFYLIAYRHKELTDGKKNLMFLQNLQLTKIISCKLNPLKVCQPSIVQSFATVTRNYQLAYCYSIIERNNRMHIPVLNYNPEFLLQQLEFFPFDPYLLPLSRPAITANYYNFEISSAAVSDPITIKSSINPTENDEDDFMDETFSVGSELSSSIEKYYLGTSPGMCKTFEPPVNSQSLFL